MLHSLAKVSTNQQASSNRKLIPLDLKIGSNFRSDPSGKDFGIWNYWIKRINIQFIVSAKKIFKESTRARRRHWRFFVCLCRHVQGFCWNTELDTGWSCWVGICKDLESLWAALHGPKRHSRGLHVSDTKGHRQFGARSANLWFLRSFLVLWHNGLWFVDQCRRPIWGGFGDWPDSVGSSF